MVHTVQGITKQIIVKPYVIFTMLNGTTVLYCKLSHIGGWTVCIL